MAMFRLEANDFLKLEKVMIEFRGDTEKVVNDVLHNEAGQLIKEEIIRLMPKSGRKWKGKKGAAKNSNSLKIKGDDNLAVEVKTTNNYHYLYFPDDGTNTRKHIGNQQFFSHGAKNQSEEIINRCIDRLVNSFGNETN